MSNLPTSKDFIEEFLKSAAQSNGCCLHASKDSVNKLSSHLDILIDTRILGILIELKEKGLLV